MSAVSRLPRILKLGNPALRRVCDKVGVQRILKSGEDKAGFFSFLRTFHEVAEHTPAIEGISAPQIGGTFRVLLLQHQNTHVTLIDPVVVSKSKEFVVDIETCISLPGVAAFVGRHQEIVAQYHDEKGVEKEITLSDYKARAFQHEFDHLDGTLLLDRVASEHLLFDKEELDQMVHDPAMRKHIENAIHKENVRLNGPKVQRLSLIGMD